MATGRAEISGDYPGCNAILTFFAVGCIKVFARAPKAHIVELTVEVIGDGQLGIDEQGRCLAIGKITTRVRASSENTYIFYCTHLKEVASSTVFFQSSVCHSSAVGLIPPDVSMPSCRHEA